MISVLVGGNVTEWNSIPIDVHIINLEVIIMKVVTPSHSILLPESPLKHIEKIGRICYKSEDAITDTSAEGFVSRLVIML